MLSLTTNTSFFLRNISYNEATQQIELENQVTSRESSEVQLVVKE